MNGTHDCPRCGTRHYLAGATVVRCVFCEHVFTTTKTKEGVR